MVTNWLRRVTKRDGGRSYPSLRRNRLQRRLSLESLEHRIALATFHAAAVGDGLAGSLRQAILQANATPEADTILLARGTYSLSLAGAGEDAGATGDLDIFGNVTIRGRGQTNTIISAAGLGDRVFDLHGGNVVIRDMTVRGGRAQQGGGFHMEDGNLTMTRCRLIDNSAESAEAGHGQGGGLYQTGGALVVNHCTFLHNQAIGADNAPVTPALGAAEGGGMYLEDVTATISGSTFQSNGATGGDSGTGFGCEGGSAAGGAICAWESTVTARDCVFSANTAIGGDGADNEEDAPSGGDTVGGAVAVESSTLTFQRCTVRGNSARGGAGGDGVVGANGGNAWGGGVNASVGSTLIIDRSTLKGNQAVGGNGGGGAIEFPADRHHFGGDALGGAIFQLVHSNLTVTNSSLLNNRVTGGKGGGGDYGGLGGDGSGGAVFTGSDMLKDTFNDTLVSSVATANHAVGGAAGTGTIQHGGGGAAEGGAFFFGSFSNAIVRRCTVTSNQAIGAGTASGGGLNSYGYSAAIIDSFFGDNQALGGVASFGAGGAIFAREFQRLAITGSTFRRNTAQGGAGIEGVDGGFGQGGAIRILGGGQKYSTVEIQSSVFSRDRALGGVGGSGANGGGALGGAIQNTDAILRITKCTCDSNSALAGAQGAGGTGGEAQGGAIQSDQANGVFLIACTVTRNRALGTIGKGGGIYLEPDTGMAQIKVSTVKKNVASTEGNDIYGPYTT